MNGDETKRSCPLWRAAQTNVGLAFLVGLIAAELALAAYVMLPELF